eukprot:TRINITY_DN5073_c0_g3_i1.p1 TRINITY_DN5073_c0_g3~~TRINITY_DN5073_c0_g3_i1.p1  ORF type:complete len:308 (-),score=78.59 TRINITY_DN5073_c0_g3_i1:303-1226(-)
MSAVRFKDLVYSYDPAKRGGPAAVVAAKRQEAARRPLGRSASSSSSAFAAAAKAARAAPSGSEYCSSEDAGSVARSTSLPAIQQDLTSRLKKAKISADPAKHLRTHPIQCGSPPVVKSLTRENMERPVAMSQDARWSTDLTKLASDSRGWALQGSRTTAGFMPSPTPFKYKYTQEQGAELHVTTYNFEASERETKSVASHRSHPKPLSAAAAAAAALPYQREKLEERKKLFSSCDPNGNGYASFAELDNIISKRCGFKQDQKMIMLKCYNEMKNYGMDGGVSDDYIEAKEFRMFLEKLAKALAETPA